METGKNHDHLLRSIAVRPDLESSGKVGNVPMDLNFSNMWMMKLVDKRVRPSCLVFCSLLLLGCTSSQTISATTPCSEDWFEFIESQIGTSDGQGHGPDRGSDEWKSVVEFKLNIRGKPSTPNRQSDEWCAFIDRYVKNSNDRNSSDPTRGSLH